MLTSIINRILNKLPPVFTKRNQFELPIEIKGQPPELVIADDGALAVNEIETETVAEIEAESVNAAPVIIKPVNIEPPKAEPVVGIFVDLDNVIGQLGDYKTEQAVVRNIDLFFIHMAKRYEGKVQVNVYGNLSPWKLNKSQLELENIRVSYIDTPVRNDHGKTTTDTKMAVDMTVDSYKISQCVLVSCDIDFEHPVAHYQQEGIPVELIQFGHTNHELKVLVNTIVNGFDILKEAKILKLKHVAPTFNSKKPTSTTVIAKTKRPVPKYADKMLIEAIESSDGDYLLAQASLLLKEFKADDWRGYKTFTQFVQSLNIPNLKIDKSRDGLLSIDEPVVVGHSVEKKLKQMEVPVLTAKQYDSIFKTLATCSLNKAPSQLVETAYAQCKESECAVTRQELEKVIIKVLPDIKKSNKPYVLAAKYLKWLFQKSKVSFKGLLNTQDRENLTLLIQG